jgi:hypothetical protein
MLLGFSVGPDEAISDQVRGQPHAVLKSFDDGANWFLLRRCCGWGALLEGTMPNAELDDGTLLADICLIFMKHSGEGYIIGWRSGDGGISWEGGPREIPLSFPPDLILQPNDRPTPGRAMAKGSLEGNVVQLANGDLLRIANFALSDDEMHRVCLLKSTDRGASWSYMSTVADPTTESRNFNESALLRLPDGSFLSMMRTMSGEPMYQSKSTDGGLTWSKPVSAGVNGVRPHMELMSNGVIACSYGRLSYPPSLGDQVMFSLDGGESWMDHTTIYHGPSTGYTSMVEVRPGELLLAYDVLGFGWRKRKINSIMTVNIKVERK